MEKAVIATSYKQIKSHLANRGVVKVSDKLVMSIAPALNNDRSKVLVLFSNTQTKEVLLSEIKLLPAPLQVGQKLVAKFDGVISEIYSVNPKNKTYHTRVVFIPATCARSHVQVGARGNVSFSSVGRNQFTIESLSDQNRDVAEGV